jgi:hypothetical protein
MKPGGNSLSTASARLSTASARLSTALARPSTDSARVGFSREGGIDSWWGEALFYRAAVLLLVLGLALGTGTLVVIEPLLGIVAAAGLTAAWAFLRCRELSILAVFFLVPLGPLLWITPDGVFSVQKIVIGGLVAVWLTRLLLAKDRTIFTDFTRSRLNLWGLLFLVVFLIPLPWCRDAGAAYALIARWVCHLVLLYFLVFTVTSFAFFRRCLAALVIVGALISAAAIVEHFTEMSVLEATGRSVQLIKGEETGEVVSVVEGTIRESARVAWSRSMATFKGPNELSLFLILVSGLALYFIFRPASSRLTRFLAVGALVLGITALDFTGSRGGLSGFLILVGVFVMLRRFPFKWFLFSAACMALLIMILTPGEPGTRWRGGLSWEMMRGDERVQWIEMSADMFLDHPVAGIGLGQFEPRYYDYRVPNMPKRHYPPHNIFCQFGAENGALGLLLLFFMIYAVIRELRRLRSEPLGEDHYLMGNTLLAVFAGMMTFSLTSNVLLDETFWTFIALVAIVSTLHGRAREKAATEKKREEEEFLVVIMPRGGRVE